MAFTYQITEHRFKSADGGIDTTEAYSGLGSDQNDVSKISVTNYGPLPTGKYFITPAVNHPMLGPVAMYLEPYHETKMYGRGGFYIHGDSSEHPGQASHGCIILPHAVRVAVNNSTDKELDVVA